MSRQWDLDSRVRHTLTHPVLAALAGCQQPRRTDGGVSGSLSSQLSPALISPLPVALVHGGRQKGDLNSSLVASYQWNEIACEGRQVGRKEC